MKNFALLILLLIITACAGAPKEITLTSSAFDLSDHGIVMGEMIMYDDGLNWGVGIVLKEMKSGVTYLIKGAKKFYVKLPPGDYQLFSIGGMNRDKKPLDDANAIKFKVKPGQTQYIGSFIENYVGNMKIYNSYRNQNKAVAEHKYIGYVNFLAWTWTYSNEVVSIYEVDNYEDVQKDFQTKYPELKKFAVENHGTIKK